MDEHQRCHSGTRNLNQLERRGGGGDEEVFGLNKLLPPEGRREG